MTEEQRQEELKRRNETVGQVGVIRYQDGSEVRVRVIEDHGLTMEVETLDETENYRMSVLTTNFYKQT